MMICPESFIEDYREYSYAELIEVRNKLVIELIEYENSLKSGWFDNERVEPGPDVIYQMNQEYLIEVIRLMQEKYDEEMSLIESATAEEQFKYVFNVFYGRQAYVPEAMIKKAKAILDKLVADDYADAVNFKGALYYEGYGYKKNQKKAIALYKKAAELGSSLAMSNLGYAYLYGHGAEVDYEKAYKYFTMAEQRGEWDALNKLGDMYKDGIYVPKDERMAFSIYNHGYEMVNHDGNNDAYPGVLRRLGECLYKGIGVDVDMVAAKKLLEESIAIFEAQIAEGNYYAKLSIVRAKELLAEIESM